MKRKHIPSDVETDLLANRSMRRCCVCYGLHRDMEPKPGQIAHLDRNSANPAPENLAWLCLNHHDQYDSQTSQSKGLTQAEVKTYRAKLEAAIQTQFPTAPSTKTEHTSPPFSLWDDDVPEIMKELRGSKIADKMIQYRGHHIFIGLCRLRVYNVRDRQLVVIVSQFPDNPGTSITNVAESLATQVYHEELKSPRNGMVWIQHYVPPYGHPDLEAYSRVRFKETAEGFVDPEWEALTFDQVRNLVEQEI